MATKIHVELLDDLDGSPASQTVRFALDGSEFEIDLTDEHAAQLRDVFTEFTGAARRSRAQTGRQAKPNASNGVDVKAVREWAHAQGISVNPRGRIAQQVIDQYIAAN